MNQVPLDDLNPPQREAVLHEGSPLLVLAGAGSGKTRVVTYRIARLILDRGVPAGRILAVTFTNKAAREMSERIAAMAGERSRGLWIGTFHAMCARLLRRHADRLGYPREFTIYDTDEQRSLIRKVVMKLNWDSEKWQPAKVQSRISHAKNHLITPEMMAARGRKAEDSHLAEIYERYLAALKDAGAMDFDDLLLNALRLFTEHEDLKGQYQNQFEHVIVDEYQDTNEPQDSLTKILAEPRRELCVVGDDDQSIYRWRGAQFENILQLPKVYPDLRIIRLERNYRSTTQIIKAAQAVISNNRDRHGKELFTEREEGAPVGLLSVENEEDEARRVAELIAEALREEVPAREISVLYRTNAQSRVLEEALVRAEIPYRVVGGLAFYQRKEIKTLLSYLRLLVQPHDDLAFLRIVNYPRRGIGETTLRQLQAKAGALRVSLFEAAKSAANFPEIGASGAQKLQAVCLWINRWTVGLEERPLADTLRRVIEETEFEDALRKEE
ncbi:MAG: UvrD-helicase domain-containing protein, partial [Candidatus Omnitrophica bacterium]|nr:UvrD-helicase domain-containing protein [Candidatus Omnitrophota bacterium]